MQSKTNFQYYNIKVKVHLRYLFRHCAKTMQILCIQDALRSARRVRHCTRPINIIGTYIRQYFCLFHNIIVSIFDDCRVAYRFRKSKLKAIQANGKINNNFENFKSTTI